VLDVLLQTIPAGACILNWSCSSSGDTPADGRLLSSSVWHLSVVPVVSGSLQLVVAIDGQVLSYGEVGVEVPEPACFLQELFVALSSKMLPAGPLTEWGASPLFCCAGDTVCVQLNVKVPVADVGLFTCQHTLELVGESGVFCLPTTSEAPMIFATLADVPLGVYAAKVVSALVYAHDSSGQVSAEWPVLSEHSTVQAVVVVDPMAREFHYTKSLCADSSMLANDDFCYSVSLLPASQQQSVRTVGSERAGRLGTLALLGSFVPHAFASTVRPAALSCIHFNRQDGLQLAALLAEVQALTGLANDNFVTFVRVVALLVVCHSGGCISDDLLDEGSLDCPMLPPLLSIKELYSALSRRDSFVGWCGEHGSTSWKLSRSFVWSMCLHRCMVAHYVFQHACTPIGEVFAWTVKAAQPQPAVEVSLSLPNKPVQTLRVDMLTGALMIL
jgi:hypothetical protein